MANLDDIINYKGKLRNRILVKENWGRIEWDRTEDKDCVLWQLVSQACGFKMHMWSTLIFVPIEEIDFSCLIFL